MNEHGFVRKVHKKIRDTKQMKKVWKVNDNFQGGVPDAYYLGPADDLWVEYKYISCLPKRSTTKIYPGLSALQHDWLSNLLLSGKQAWVAVGHPRGVWVGTDQRALNRCLKGISQEEFVTESLRLDQFVVELLDVCA